MKVIIIIMWIGVAIAIGGIVLYVSVFLTKSLREFRLMGGKQTAEETEEIIKSREKWKIISVCVIITGLTIAAASFFIGYSARGEGFLFYKDAVPALSSNITESGKYLADSSKEYTYYIIVCENTYSFCDVPCESIDDLEDKLSGLALGDTVLLVDNCATSAAYKSARSMLNEMGLKYEMEEE